MIEKLKAKAERVGEVVADRAAAFQAEHEAEGAVLATAITTLLGIEGALPALGSRVLAAQTSTRRGKTAEVSSALYLDTPGVKVAGTGLVQREGEEERGRIDGRALYLLVDGRLAELHYTGTWSAWTGEETTWTASVAFPSPPEAMQRWELDVVLDALEEALDAQLGGKSEARTRQAEERAERLRAIVTLARRP